MRQSGTLSTPRGRLVVGMSAIVAALSVAAACSGSGAAPTAGPATPDALRGAELVLLFDEVAVPGDAVPTVVNEGDVPAAVAAVTSAGGRLTWTDGWQGGGVRTPAYGESEDTPAAALVLRPAEGSLDPGTRGFVLGVDFNSDRPTKGRSGDDGDNLLQRGRFDGTAQLKLQLDHGVPSCRLSGSAGAVVVSAKRSVTPGRWYRMTCERSAGRVLLRLRDLASGSIAGQWHESADPGEIRFDDEPVAVGAKVSASGRIDPAGTDQFHGVIDRVFIDVR